MLLAERPGVAAGGRGLSRFVVRAGTAWALGIGSRFVGEAGWIGRKVFLEVGGHGVWPVGRQARAPWS